MSDTALTLGAHHIGFTVPNLSETRDFFIDVLGFAQIGEKPGYPAVFVSDGTIMITLWQVDDAPNAAPFDRKSVVGLHHFALKVADTAALSALHARLQETPGVAVEFTPEPLGAGPARHMMCAIPGGLRMELIAPTG